MKTLLPFELSEKEKDALFQDIDLWIARKNLKDLLHPTPITQINDQIFVKREDLRHPFMSGNKWHKLKFNLYQAERLGYQELVSVGGGYSNHIHALAAAARYLGFESVGYIRQTERTTPDCLTPTLLDAQAWGMRLQFLTRGEFRARHQDGFVQWIETQHQKAFWLPEGGSNEWAVLGLAQLAQEIYAQAPEATHWFVPCGTGVTLAGLLVGLQAIGQAQRVQLMGVSVLKGKRFLGKTVEQYLRAFGAPNTGYQILHDFDHGGYARVSSELQTYYQGVFNQLRQQVDLDRIYTGKMLYAVEQLRANGFLQKHDTLMLVHTGGLQGNRS